MGTLASGSALSGCSREPDVQLQVIAFAVGTGSSCPAPSSACFLVRIKNVGTDQGSGRCDIPYFRGPDPPVSPSTPVVNSTLVVKVNNLAPEAVATQYFSRKPDSAVIQGAPSTCHPGAAHATP
jgi:hypothetical protein